MTLKALAEAALQLCAERTLPRTLPEKQTAHYTPENQDDRTLQDGDEGEAMELAKRAIQMAALTDEQRAARIADARRDPAIARLWAMAWPEARGKAGGGTP